MYKIKLIITQIIFVVLYLSITIAQPTVISGVAYNAMGKKIHLVTYEDYISNNLLELSSTVIDTAGKFTMEVPLSSTCYASIQIDEYVADIYLKPHKKIIINIAPEQYDEGVAYLFQPKLLNITFSEIPPDDINLLIYEFNLIYDNFIHDNFKKIYYKRNFNIVDSFNLCISNKYNNINDNYFLDYVKYKMANFELITRRKSKSDIIKTYFDPENIKYNNAAYMEFFNTFFDGYFNDIAGKIDEVELVSAVNKQKSYIALFNALGKDSLLKNERLRELVMLVTLRNMYYTQGYDRKAVENILHELSEISKFKQHKTIALNLIKKIDKFKKGSPAPYFKLKDKNEQFVSLNDFKGKYIYLTFWNTQCVDCEAEFELINNVYNKIKAKTEVVSISTDKHFLTMQLFLKKKKYLWTFLHFNGDYQLLENYQVKTVPFYILIGPEGEIIDYPAKSPIYNLENYLNKNISTKN